ncbi:alpha/beta hydrolase [Desulfosarcina widdelii]|uniref:Alpha/beta hydrolase n=1 Tax=Desulfosarcina widdelii TaxID=947919 RepID=A0A5K7Z6K0_9BACT|nr:alpha/beta hydrolase [Desulfosarcina widdelii]BBO76370.1 alpha/beta hydrolase [Desulfosarcina widdelii]
MERQIHFDNHLGETLAGTLHEPDGPPLAAVVAGHCFTCSRHTGILRRICTSLCDAGFMALRFDFSGNGQSQGSFEQSTWSKQVLEMEAAIDLVQQHGVQWIGLAGHSLGAAIALLTAHRQAAVSAVCRVAGRTSPTRAMHFLTPDQQTTLSEAGRVEFTSRGRNLSLNSDFFDDAGRHDLEATTRALKVPMLVVHGDRDEIISVSEAHLAKEANPDHVELVIVSGGDHMLALPEHQKQVSRTVTEWFFRQAGFSKGEPKQS